MANSRITRAMAEKAAQNLGKDKFGKKTQEKTNELQEYAIQLFEKYVPLQVREAFDANKNWYENKSYIAFAADGGGAGSYMQVYLSVSVAPLRTVIVSAEEFMKLSRLKEQISTLNAARHKFEMDVSTVLLSLGYEKRVREQFPQALPYLNFSGTTEVAPNIQNLIRIIEQD